MPSPTLAADSAGPAVSEAKPARWFTPERLLRISLWVIGLMWLLPFLAPFKAPPIPSFHAENLAAVLGLLAMSALPSSSRRLELPRVGLLLLSFTGLIVVQTLLGRLAYYQVGLLGTLYLLWATGLVILGGVLRRNLGLERVASTLAWFLVAGALVSAVIAWAQYIESDALTPLGDRFARRLSDGMNVEYRLVPIPRDQIT
jgi:hypothetical protein